MTTAILDTNVLVQAVISSPRSASARTLDALFQDRFQLVCSPEVIDEWLAVLSLPRMRARHGMTDDELLEFLAAILVNAERHPGEADVSARLVRDVTDTKLLSLAIESQADYLVTKLTTVGICCHCGTSWGRGSPRRLRSFACSISINKETAAAA
jgi:putative PIN family toxin of toxin-antitoxin system